MIDIYWLTDTITYGFIYYTRYCRLSPSTGPVQDLQSGILIYFFCYTIFKVRKLLTNKDYWVVYALNVSQEQLLDALWHVDTVFGSGTALSGSVFERKWWSAVVVCLFVCVCVDLTCWQFCSRILCWCWWPLAKNVVVWYVPHELV